MKHRLEYAGFLVASWVLRALPYRLASGLGRAGGTLFFWLSRYRRRLAFDNIRQALPELSAGESRTIARRSFAHHGAMFFEAASADRFVGHEFDALFDVDGWEHVDRLVAEGRGFFLMTGHFGAVEQALYPLTRRLGPLHMVIKAQRNPYVNDNIRRMRTRRGHLLIYSRRAGHRMLNAVRKGGRVTILVDHRVQPHDGVLLPFLGRPAWTPINLARLSNHSGCPVVPLYCVPTAGGRYHLQILAPIEPEGSGLVAEIALTRRYLAALETQIRRRPDLWYWMHTRWRLTIKYGRKDVQERLVRRADLPADRRLETFDERRLGRDLRATFTTLRGGAFLEACRNIVVIGAPGSGRTHTAAALVEALAQDGRPARFAVAGPFLDSLLAARSAGTEAEVWAELDRVELLALDDLDQITDPQLEMLTEVLRQRRSRRSTLLITADQKVPEPGQGAENLIREALASAVVMRLARPAAQDAG